MIGLIVYKKREAEETQQDRYSLTKKSHTHAKDDPAKVSRYYSRINAEI